MCGYLAPTLVAVSLLVTATATADSTVRGGDARLIDAGKPPLRVWAFAKPHHQALRIQFQMGVEEAGQPPATIVLHAEPTGNGWTLTGKSMRLPLPETVHVSDEEMSRLWSCATQIRGRLRAGERGFELRFELPDDPNDDKPQKDFRAATRSLLQAVADSLPTLGALIPTKPVGDGARWDTLTQIRKEESSGAATLTTELHHRLTRRGAHVASTALDGRMAAGPTTVDRETIEVHGTVQGEVIVDDRAPLPSRVAVRSNVEATVGTKKVPMRIDWALEAVAE